MAIEKSKTLDSGVTANYWRIKKAVIDIDAMNVKMIIGLYLDSQHGTSESTSVFDKPFELTLTQEQLATGGLANAYVRILEKANTDVPNLIGEGTHKFDLDLEGGVIVA